MADEKISTIGCFRILTDLKSGAGSQGSVYKAVCEREGFAGVKPGDVVALKVMTVQDGAERYQRLKGRTDELAALDHPNVVRYHGCFSERDAFNDIHVVVLEFLEGVSLKDRLQASPLGLDADEALDVAGQALEGLRYLSGRGIVHRDVKPGNIFVCSDGRVKLIDFEVARRDCGTTATIGGMVGTFDYMAPDFIDSGFRGDESSDIFSFAVTFHEMLTGRTPYRVTREGDTQSNFAFLSRWSGHTAEHSAIHVSARVRRVLSGASELLEKALAPDRAVRYRTFAELAKDFAHVGFRELTYGSFRWRLLLYVGRGGFGEVFKARDVATNQLVAIKHLLHPEAAERFRREARIMGEVNGPYFVRLVAFFERKEKGTSSAFLVMDYLPGMPGASLQDVIRAGGEAPLPRRPVLQAFLRYARALTVLHSRGLVHRDIKPANLYFPEKSPERAVIMDFGIVRDVSGTATVGQLPGTLDYMPPESIKEGWRGDAGMDIYALGLCLYEALSGKPAYPRIPQGPGGLRMFFDRAQAMKPPKLDASAYCDCPELVGLLLEMIEPIAERRLQSATVVERRIADILGLDAACTGRPSEGLVQVAEDASTACNDPNTSPTVVADAAALDLLRESVRASEPRSGEFRRLVALLACALLVVVGGALAYIQVRHMQTAAAAAEQDRREAEARRLETERRRQEEAAAEAERKRQAAAAAAERRRREEAAAAAEEKKRREEADALEAEQKRLAAVVAEAERKRREAEAAAAEAERKLREEAAAAAAERKRRQAETAAAEAERKRQQAVAIAADAERKRQAEAAAAAAERKRRQAEAAAAEAERKRRQAEAAAAEAERRRQAEAAAAEAERRRQAEAAAAEAERRRQAEAAVAEAERRRQAEAAVADRKRKQALAEVTAMTERVRQQKTVADAAEKRRADAKQRQVEAELARIKAEFEQEEAAYLVLREKALKPGSREDPNELDLKWYMRRREYMRQRRRLERSVQMHKDDDNGK